MTSNRRHILQACAALTLASMASLAGAQAYPVKLIYSYAPGGPGDAIARLPATSLFTLAGDVKVYYNTPSGSLIQHLKDGKLKLIAVASAAESPLLPGAAPIAKYLPGYVQDINYAIYGPPGMPAAIVARLGDAIRKSMAEPGMTEKFQANGVAVALGGPEEVVRITQREAANIKRILETTPVKFGE